MKKHRRNRNSTYITIALAAVLFVILIGLTAALIMTFLATSAETDAFDLNRMTADKTGTSEDISGLLLPEFAGITSGGVRRGISSQRGILEEIFRLVSPLISELVTAPRMEGALTEEEWIALADENDSVYLRFHQRIPLSVLTMFSGLYQERKGGISAEGYVWEMLILPYRDSSRGDGGIVRIAVRDVDGSVTLFVKASPESLLTKEQLAQTAQSYRNNLTEFEFAGDSYKVSSPTEPVFLSSMIFRNIIITGETAPLILESKLDTDQLLRVFALNPDKLLSTHRESDGTVSFIDSRGGLYIGNSEIRYTSTSDGGIRMDNLTAIRGDTVEHTLESYVTAAAVIWNSVRNINRMCAGDEADIVLTSVSSQNNVVSLRFLYTLDNLRIASDRPAFEAVFENGILRSVRIHTISVMTLGTRSESLSERWFLRTLEGSVPDDVTLVYRARYAAIDSADYSTDSIGVEWAGITVGRKEENNGA